MINKVACICFLIVITLACGDSKKSSSTVNAENLFKTNCSLCHGMDGKLGANGSKDLTVSPMTMDDRVKIITNGKGAMTPFGAILSADEIKAVAEYTFSLK